MAFENARCRVGAVVLNAKNYNLSDACGHRSTRQLIDLAGWSQRCNIASE